jgi:hypothetical protein
MVFLYFKEEDICACVAIGAGRKTHRDGGNVRHVHMDRGVPKKMSRINFEIFLHVNWNNPEASFTFCILLDIKMNITCQINQYTYILYDTCPLTFSKK